MQDRVRILATMEELDYLELKVLAGREGKSIGSYLAGALAHTKYLYEQRKQGKKIIVEDSWGTQQEVIFK